MSFLASVAWRNLWRHKRRSFITSAAMAVGVALCMALMAYSDGMYAQLFDVMVEQQLGHAQVHHPDYPGRRQLYDTIPSAHEVMDTIAPVPATRVIAPRVYGAALLGGQDTSTGAMLKGVDPARERLLSSLHERVEDGRWLDDTPRRDIVLGVGLAELLEVGIGDEVVAVTQATDGSIGNEAYAVVGLIRSGSAQLDKSGAYLHIADLQDLLLLDDQVHELTLLATRADDDAIATWIGDIRQALRDVTVQTEDGPAPLLVRPWWEASPPTRQIMEMRDASMFITLGIVFTVAAFGVLNTMMMSVFERTRELGVLKAIGLRPRKLVGMVLFESIFLAALSVGMGLVLGGILDALLVVYGLDLGAAGEEFTFNGVTIDTVIKGEVRADPIVFTAAAVFLVSVLASLWPAWRAARLEPVKTLRHE